MGFGGPTPTYLKQLGNLGLPSGEKYKRNRVMGFRPKPLSIPSGPFQFFPKICGEFLQLKLHHRSLTQVAFGKYLKSENS
jgi:hypothetical protein